MSRTIIRNATVVDPSQGYNGRMDLVIEGNEIADVVRNVQAGEGSKVIDATGLVLAPGFIDLHTHLREPGGETAETIETGTRAAAAGGFTTIFCMPNTNPVCDSETGVHYIISRASTLGCVNVVPIAAITKGQKGEELTNFARLLSVGAGAFSDDGHPVMNADIMRRALEYTKLLGVPVMEHCEDMNLTGEGVMNEGAVSIRLGLRGIPRVSESTMVARNVALAAATGGHIHICHVSTRESVQAIRDGKRNGVHVTAEVSPHHLTMTDEAVLNYNTMAKMKPPVCGIEDREALIQAIEDGTLDCVATDHAPHSSSAKANVFDAAPYGIIGMESAFPVLYTEFVATGRWTLDFLIEKLTTGPANVMNAGWGTLRKGRPADFTLLELKTPYEFSLAHIGSRSRNCPWLGEQMRGRIVETWVSGKLVYTAPEETAARSKKSAKAEITKSVKAAVATEKEKSKKDKKKKSKK